MFLDTIRCPDLLNSTGFFLKPHAGGAPLKSDHIQKLIIGKLGPAMSVPGPGRVKTFFVLQELHAAGRDPRRRDHLSIFWLYRL
jgi:hypothetical protein